MAPRRNTKTTRAARTAAARMKKPVVCPTCSKTFAGDLKRHQQSAHPSPDGESWHKCGIDGCYFWAKQASNLSKHCRRDHLGIIIPCKLCPYVNNSHDGIFNHYKRVHGGGSACRTTQGTIKAPWLVPELCFPAPVKCWGPPPPPNRVQKKAMKEAIKAAAAAAAKKVAAEANAKEALDKVKTEEKEDVVPPDVKSEAVNDLLSSGKAEEVDIKEESGKISLDLEELTYPELSVGMDVTPIATDYGATSSQMSTTERGGTLFKEEPIHLVMGHCPFSYPHSNESVAFVPSPPNLGAPCSGVSGPQFSGVQLKEEAIQYPLGFDGLYHPATSDEATFVPPPPTGLDMTWPQVTIDEQPSSLFPGPEAFGLPTPQPIPLSLYDSSQVSQDFGRAEYESLIADWAEFNQAIRREHLRRLAAYFGLGSGCGAGISFMGTPFASPAQWMPAPEVMMKTEERC